MTVSNLVLRSGVGPTATIALFVTHGLGVGSNPPPVVTGDTHDLPLRKEDFKRYREKLKSEKARLARQEAEKLAKASSIRREIDKILHPVAETAPISEVSQPKQYTGPVLPAINYELTRKQKKAVEAMQRQINGLLAEAELIGHEQRLIKQAQRAAQDAEDMHIISLLMNAPHDEIRKQMFPVKH